jgi:hypothetical protein
VFRVVLLCREHGLLAKYAGANGLMGGVSISAQRNFAPEVDI